MSKQKQIPWIVTVWEVLEQLYRLWQRCGLTKTFQGLSVQRQKLNGTNIKWTGQEDEGHMSLENTSSSGCIDSGTRQEWFFPLSKTTRTSLERGLKHTCLEDFQIAKHEKLHLFDLSGHEAEGNLEYILSSRTTRNLSNALTRLIKKIQNVFEIRSGTQSFNWLYLSTLQCRGPRNLFHIISRKRNLNTFRNTLLSRSQTNEEFSIESTVTR